MFGGATPPFFHFAWLTVLQSRTTVLLLSQVIILLYHIEKRTPESSTFTQVLYVEELGQPI
jgi:hypothetical protein